LLLSVAALEGVTSAAGVEVVEASVSAEAVLAFFFFDDLESDLTWGFWVAEAAIVEKVFALLEVAQVCGTVVGSFVREREKYFRRICRVRMERVINAQG
jgi:hypothetical protein